MSLFTRTRRVEHLAAVGDVTGLREALVDAAREGGSGTELLGAAASALVDLGEEGVSALVEVVLSERDLAGLARIEDETFHRAAGPHAGTLLGDALLHDPDPGVRLAACGMLRRLGTTLAVEAFATAVTDPDSHVRLSAARGLADLGDARGVRALLEWVAHSDNPVPALVGLVRIGDPGVVPHLERLHAASRTSYAATAIARTIAELRSRPAPSPSVVARLERVRDHLRSIELVDGLPRRLEGSLAARAQRQVPDLCERLEHTIAVLRAAAPPDGRPVNRTQLGVELAALVERSSGEDFDRMMATVLEPRGVRALEDQMVALDLVAGELQERPTAPGRP